MIPKSACRLAALSGVLQVVIFPSLGWSFLSWFALLPFFLALFPPSIPEAKENGQPLTSAQGFCLGYLAGFIFYMCSCYWFFHVMHNYGGLSSISAAAVMVLFGLFLGLYHGVFAALLVRISRSSLFCGPRALIIAPFLWVAIELARTTITGLSWNLLGTAQVDNIPFTRLATITGVYGLSFGIVAVNALFAASFVVAVNHRNRLFAIATVAAAVLQAGMLFTAPASPATQVARLVQQNLEISNTAWTADYYDRTLAELTDISRVKKANENDRQWSAPPRLIIWPESPAPFYVNDPKFTTWMATLANDQDAYVIAGSLGLRNPPAGGSDYDIFNSAILVSPSGALVARYDKVHLVPFGEYVPFQSLLFFANKLTKQVGSFTPGSERTVFTLRNSPTESTIGHQHEGMAMPSSSAGPGSKVGVFICFESAFPGEVRQFAANGAEVFVNISNDAWFGESSAAGQHFNMARMRAIENERWLLRATNTGITASVDPLGRVVEHSERNIRTALQAPYSFISETTFYTRHGDWFAWLCAIISLCAVLLSLRPRAVR